MLTPCLTKLPTHLNCHAQISKLMIIPFVCFVEAFWLKRKFTIPIISCVLVVIAGVAVV